jgi:hypothetical protein
MKYITAIERMAIERGREEGRAEGRREVDREVVLRLLNKQMSVAEIAALLNLSIDEVEDFARSGARMAQSLQGVADRNTFGSIDPLLWQQEVRHDRPWHVPVQGDC